jgi:putative acyl-CoA dehydrogenase
VATAREAEGDLNQSPAFTDVNLFASDTPLREAVAREGAADAAENLTDFGRIAGSAAAAELGRQANENPPRLRAFDAQGRRLDRVDYHPAYHRLMGFSTAQGLHCSTWDYLTTMTGLRPGAMSRGARGAIWRRRWRPDIAAP